MPLIIKAIYRNGVIVPLEDLDLPENEKLTVEVSPLADEQGRVGKGKVTSLCGLWQDYGDITEEEIKEITGMWDKRIDRLIEEL
jgi:predicted DNA-binding antitoxin AbrB/MazE fold protein